MQKKVFIKTFGCQMNEYDSDKMADVLGASEGLVRTDKPEEADVILFNTCSVREKAQEKVFSDLGRVRELKRANPNLVIGVGGCVASQEGEAIVKRAPYVDVVFGPQTLHRLPQMIQARRASGAAQVDISFPEIEKFDHLPPAKVEAQRYRRNRAHDRQPAKRLGARVQGEHAVAQHEMERSAAAVDHHRLEHLVERPHRDQAGDRLVLVQRLAADVGRDPVQEQAAQRGDRTADQDPRPRRADSRPGRPPTRIRRRRRS